MHLRSTLLLFLLVLGGAAGWWWLDQRQTSVPSSETLSFLADKLKPNQLSRIEVRRGGQAQLTFEKNGNEWSLAGGWPVRTQEVDDWLHLLTSLGSRFAPIRLIGGPEPSTFGLNDQALNIYLTVDGKAHRLQFGEEPGEQNRFTRPTYLRVDDWPEVVRLGPGVAAQLDRKADYFRQRRLFAVERSQEKGSENREHLVAQSLEVRTPSSALRLQKSGEAWEIEQPVRDRPDPEQLKELLAAFTDLWAENFLPRTPGADRDIQYTVTQRDPFDARGKSEKRVSLAELGLAAPEIILTVVKPSGAKTVLQIGNKLPDKKRTFETKMGPPTQFGPPQMITIPVDEEYYFAKLGDHPEVFEIRAKKIPDITKSLEQLRDKHLARFAAGKVTRLEIEHVDSKIVLAKDGGKWQMEAPAKEEAETSPITELLDKLADLRAEQIEDNSDFAKLHAKPSGTVKLALEESVGEGKDAKKTSRELTFTFAQPEKEKGKLLVQVEGWPRINRVDDAIAKLVERPALTYRNRRVLDLAADLKKIEIRQDRESFTLEKASDAWKLTAPVAAEVDATKAETLAGDLARLEASELIAEMPKAEELETYGLAKPALEVKLADASKSRVLAVGKARAKGDSYARVDQGPVFTLSKATREQLEKPALAYRPLALWNLEPDELVELSFHKGKASYQVRRDGKEWKVTSPFKAPAAAPGLDELANELGRLKAERFEAHRAQDLAAYGLEPPALKLTVEQRDGATRTLLLGKTEGKGRFAKLGDREGILVVGGAVADWVERDAFDLLDRNLLALPAARIRKVQYAGQAPFSLEKTKESWQVVDSPAPAFPADEDAVDAALAPWVRLQADKFAAYGAQISWAEFGLDAKAATVTATLDDQREVAVTLGKTLDDGRRYARVEKRDAAVVLPAATAEALGRTHLDFLDRRVLKFDLDTVSALKRSAANGELELVKRDDTWQLVRPSDRAADEPTVNALLEKTFRLRAQRFAAYPAKDLAPFGLAKPEAAWTLELTDVAGGKTSHTLEVGSPAEKNGGERFARIDKGDKVVVLSAELSRMLTAAPLFYADRNLASFSGTDQLQLERGARKIAFSRDGEWKMTSPVAAPAEAGDLDDFVRSIQRLRADEIYTEKGADLARLGLETPTARWTFKAGDREQLQLLLGNETDDGRAYAKLGNKDEVFLLGSKLTGKALAEYRSRAPWPALDAAQVDWLHVRGPSSFTLRKRDSAWRLEGEDADVSSSLVTDTLDALAALKAQRYVVDASADLQLYGLKPPVWTLSVKTPMGTRTLELGRAEGDSQRLYAHVPETDAVFVISESDTRRLLRPAKAYTASPH